MCPNELQEFDLEEILKEFAPEPEAPEEPEDLLIEAPPEPEEEPQGDTIRLDRIQKQIQSDPMRRDTTEFAPVTSASEPEEEPEEESAQPPAAPSRPAVEPFSEDWEPKYEEPMGEFTAPNPIPFPKSRLRTLRQKLVSGPEHRYFELAEKGLGKLQLGIFANLLLFLISAGGLAVTEIGLISPERINLMIFGQLLVAMLAVLLSCYRLLDGIASLFKGRFNLNTLLCFTVLTCVVDGIMCLRSHRMPACPLLCLEMLMAQWSAYQSRSLEMGQMDTLRKASDLTALVKIDDYHEGRPGFVSVPGDPDSFTQHYSAPSAPEKCLNIYAALSLLVAVALAVAAFLRQGLEAAGQVMSASLLIAVPATAFISMSRPAAILQHRLHRLGSVLCGWQGIRQAPKRVIYPLTHADLFPSGSIKMNGVKFHGTVDPGRVVSYTAALIAADGEGLVEVFSLLPRSRNSRDHQVTEFIAYPNGIGGLVDGIQVLVGTAEFMEELGIELPDQGKVSLALYSVVEGQLSGVFAMTCNRSKSAAAGLRTLCGDGNVIPVLTACDFLLSPKFIRNRLGVNVRRLYLPAREIRQTMAAMQPEEDAPVIALAAREGLAPKAYALNGARALRSAWKTGAVIHILGGIIGLAAVGVLALIGALELLNPTNLLVYSLLWAIPGLLITEWTRHI